MATGESKTKWKGKAVHTNGSSSMSNPREVEISYEGKLAADVVLATTPAPLINVWSNREHASLISDNRLYYGDNLHILAALLKDKTVCGKVRLIYIDPPYSTNSVFQSRSQNAAYTDLLAGSHYIEFLRQRLILLRELLAKDGSIYVHLDENMAFHIKVVMDEVFGKNNYRNWITRKKSNPKNYTRKTYGNISDYILFYTKSDSYVWTRAVEKWTVERANKNTPTLKRRLVVATKRFRYMLRG